MKELTEEEKQSYLEWSEGNKYLYELLCTCGENEISTFASCGGHEKGNNKPYLGIVINNNSMLFIKSILAEVQSLQDIIISVDVRHSGDGQLLDDEELRGLIFYAQKFNCCELFYKMKKGIERKDKEITLKPKANRFYEAVKRLKETSREELQEDIDDQVVVGNTFSTKTQELIEYERSNQLVKNSKILRFFRKILPFKKNERKYEELKRKYDFLQRDYIEDNVEDVSATMDQYKIKNSDNQIEKNAIIQIKDISEENYGTRIKLGNGDECYLLETEFEDEEKDIGTRIGKRQKDIEDNER